MILKSIQGSIIAIASICAHVATRPQTHIPYNASKAVSVMIIEGKKETGSDCCLYGNKGCASIDKIACM